MQFSTYQKEIFSAIENTRDNLAINAVAGSGKTTVLVEIYKRLPRGSRVLFLAFNRHIVGELQSRLPGCGCKTIHSVGFGAVRKAIDKKITTNEHKMADLVDEYLARHRPKWLFTEHQAAQARMIRDIAEKSRLTLTDLGDQEAAFDMLLHFGTWGDLLDIYDEIAEKHSHLQFSAMQMAAAMIDAAQNIVQQSTTLYKKRGLIDYTDMVYLPNALGLPPMIKYDYVLVDEAQDLNRSQLGIVLASLSPQGRIVAVGDKNQAIMGFSGASNDSFDQIVAATKAKVLPLSICYRCPASHVAMARAIVPSIEAAPDADEGIIETISMEQFAPMPRRGDLVICRVNAPLVGAAMRMIASGVQARIRGRNIAAGLLKIISDADKKIAPGPEEGFIDAFTYKLNAYIDHRIALLRAKPHTEDKQATLLDQKQCILKYLEGRPDIKTIDSLSDGLDSLFADEGAAVWLSSIHRAKGLEADRVFILHSNKMRVEFSSMQDWQRVQEANVEYVGLTRAKRAMYLIEEEKTAEE